MSDVLRRLLYFLFVFGCLFEDCPLQGYDQRGTQRHICQEWHPRRPAVYGCTRTLIKGRGTRRSYAVINLLLNLLKYPAHPAILRLSRPRLCCFVTDEKQDSIRCIVQRSDSSYWKLASLYRRIEAVLIRDNKRDVSIGSDGLL